MPQIACENGSAIADRSSTTEGFGDFLAAGETFYGRILKADFTIPKTGSGSIMNNTAVCDGATYLLSVVDKTTVVGSDTTGIHIKILGINKSRSGKWEWSDNWFYCPWGSDGS